MGTNGLMKYPTFIGYVKTQWVKRPLDTSHGRNLFSLTKSFIAEHFRLGKYRSMVLLDDVIFYDDRGGEWRVPKGYRFNGLSIPRWLWWVAGGPYSDDAREASCLHDYLCDTRTVSAWQTHHLFWLAMKASNVHPGRAWLKWAAVVIANLFLHISTFGLSRTWWRGPKA